MSSSRPLANERSVTGHPVFALEHGLDAKERKTLAADVRASLKVGAPSDAYWLPHANASTTRLYD